MFPADAGMNRKYYACVMTETCVPRRCGDEIVLSMSALSGVTDESFNIFLSDSRWLKKAALAWQDTPLLPEEMDFLAKVLMKLS